MLLHLTGVLESGATRGARVPANPRVTIQLAQTESLTIRLLVLDVGGTAVDLTAVLGQLVLSVKVAPPQEPALISRLGILQPQLGVGYADFEVVPFDTKPDRMPAGRYVYDVWLEQVSGERDPVVPLSPFVLEPAVRTLSGPVTTPVVVPGLLTPETHRSLRQLIHFINTGPARGFLSGAFREILPLGNPFPTSITWWSSPAKVGKLVEKLLVRNLNQTPSSITWNMYADDGVTVVESTTDVISYSGVFETSRTRAIA